jgi:hypothetical protein
MEVMEREDCHQHYISWKVSRWAATSEDKSLKTEEKYHERQMAV